MQQNIQDSNSNNCDSNNKIIHVKTFLFHCHTALFQYLGNLICIYSFNYCCFGPTSDTHTSNYTRLLWWKLQKKKKKTLWSLFMDGVQQAQGYSHFEEAVYFLPLSSQKFLVLILSTWEGWKAESILEPLSGFEHRTPGLGI